MASASSNSLGAAEHMVSLSDVEESMLPFLPDEEAAKYLSAATTLIKGEKAAVQSLCAKRNGWNVSLRGSGIHSDSKRPFGEIKMELAAKVVSRAREFLVRKWARGTADGAAEHATDDTPSSEHGVEEHASEHEAADTSRQAKGVDATVEVAMHGAGSTEGAVAPEPPAKRQRSLLEALAVQERPRGTETVSGSTPVRKKVEEADRSQNRADHEENDRADESDGVADGSPAEDAAISLPFANLFPRQSGATMEVLRWVDANPKDAKVAGLAVELRTWERRLRDGSLNDQSDRFAMMRECAIELSRKRRWSGLEGHMAVVRDHYLSRIEGLRMRTALSDCSCRP